MHKKIVIFWLIALFFLRINAPLFAEETIENAELHNQLAYSALKNGDYKQAFIEGKTAESLALKEKNTIELARAISNIASTHLYFGEYDKALGMYLESLDISKKDNNLDGIERALNNISAIYTRIDRSEEALQYLLKLPVVNGIERSSHDQLVGYISLASRYREVGNIEQAEKYIGLAEAVAKFHPEPFLEVYLFLELAKLKKENNIISDSVSYLKKALALTKRENFDELRVVILRNLAELHFHFNDLQQAKLYALQALDFSTELGLPTEQEMTYVNLILIERKLGNYKKALSYVDLNKQLTERIKSAKIQQLAEITKVDRNMAETEEKLRQSIQQREIAELKYERHKQLQINTTILFLIVIALISFWFYRRNSRMALQRQIDKNAQLQELDHLKDRILTNTSHELRTPLNGIIGLSEAILIDANGTLDEDTKSYVRLIGKSGSQLSEIINDILDLAQLRANKMVFNNTTFKVNTLVTDVVTLCQPLLGDRDIRIKLAPLEPDVEVCLDEKRVRQILFNIVGNAIKFTKKGFVKVSIEHNKNWLQLTVEDTGIGIPKDKIERIFEGFEQVNQSDTREQGGSGLGLAICNQLLSALGGTIAVSSELNKGTTMVIKLPTEPAG